MSCPECGSGEAHRPAAPCSYEEWTCKSCDHVYWVRIHYLIEPGPDHVMHVMFTGTYIPCYPREAIKSHIKLKRLLKGCERFSLAQLERQFVDQQPVWELGDFLDDDVERLLPECERLGLQIEFRVAVYED